MRGKGKVYQRSYVSFQENVAKLIFDGCSFGHGIRLGPTRCWLPPVCVRVTIALRSFDLGTASSLSPESKHTQGNEGRRGCTVSLKRVTLRDFALIDNLWDLFLFCFVVWLFVH